ncbi:helix-turn-helix domain-containing protein [Lactococcus sp.]|uniref:helix-turn-helix domain-containing protein n=1 Tax=Lactococcus sp. TaxID=44273 RepID=UPI002FC5A2EB
MNEGLFYKRVRTLGDKLGKSLNQIEKELGYSRNALSNYKTKTMPSAIRLLELADYFEVNPKYLLGMNEICSKNTAEKNFTELLFENLDKKQKLEICRISQIWMLQELMNNQAQ